MPTCKWVRAACQRQLDDLDRFKGKDSPYRFNPKLTDKLGRSFYPADNLCAFIERLPHVKGPLAGTPIKLEPWQVFILTTVFGWIKPDGNRRFRRSYIEVPRGNAKSTLSSALALYMLAADGEGGAEVYGTASMLDWIVNKKDIAPHVPVWERTGRSDGSLASSEFTWDEHANEYRCPQGNPLRSQWRPMKIPRSHITQADTIIYRASQMDCEQCSIKDRCCPNTPVRKITRSIHEAARNVARAISATPEYLQSRKDRKKVEMLFAHLKRILKPDRLRLRGIKGAQDEFLMAATAQNLRRMAKWLVPGAEKGAMTTT